MTTSSPPATRATWRRGTRSGASAMRRSATRTATRSTCSPPCPLQNRRLRPRTEAELAERGAGQRSHVVGEVRLIGVAALRGDRGKRDTPPGERQRVAEAQDSGQQLRAVAERVESPALQLASRQPDRRRDRRDPVATAGTANDVGEHRVDHGGAPSVAGHDRLQPADRAGRRGDLLLEPPHLGRRPQRVERDPGVAHGVGGDPEDRGPEARREAQAGVLGTRRVRRQEAAAIGPGDDEMAADPQQVHAAVGEHAAGGPVRLGRPRDRPGDRRRPLPVHACQPATAVNLRVACDDYRA